MPEGLFSGAPAVFESIGLYNAGLTLPDFATESVADSGAFASHQRKVFLQNPCVYTTGWPHAAELHHAVLVVSHILSCITIQNNLHYFAKHYIVKIKNIYISAHLNYVYYSKQTNKRRLHISRIRGCSRK